MRLKQYHHKLGNKLSLHIYLFLASFGLVFQ